MTENVEADLCFRIVAAVAEEREVDPADIDDRLYDVIDAEALGRLVDRARTSDSIELSVSFRMAGCFVTVTGEDTVRATTPN